MQAVADLQDSSDIPDAMRSNENSNLLVVLNCFVNLLADIVLLVRSSKITLMSAAAYSG